MKTDITEKDGYYTLDMELPGCKKEDIHLELKDGYLNVSAARNAKKEEKDAKGSLVRQERYSGTFSRSFYVGDKLSEEDIKAGYENGELKITFPKEVREDCRKRRPSRSSDHRRQFSLLFRCSGSHIFSESY